MEPVKKLEIPQVLKILDKVGVSGYTRIEDVAGKGDRGRVINDLDHTLTNGYVISVCTVEQEDELVEAIRPILKKFGGVCIVSDGKWIVH
jgi:nitrogen regulatory protein PII